MTSASDGLQRLALENLHEGLGARMAAFAGWRMPVQYPAGLKAEHLHVRQQAGLFDVSHMGQIRVTPRNGKVATLHKQLEAALPVDFVNWRQGIQRYSLLLNDDGGIEDDLMMTNLGESVFLVVNAGNRDADFALLNERCPELEFEWVDAALIALQGPKAGALISEFDAHADELSFMQTSFLNLEDAYCFSARSGYTGEDGFEISIPTAAAERVVSQLLRHPSVKPIGLGARDSLRLEAGLPLHGQDITADTTPHEAGLGFAIAMSRRVGGNKEGGYPGAATIAEQAVRGTQRRLVGLTSPEAIPIRTGAAIFNEREEQVGTVTSGTLSPSLGQPVMMAYLDTAVLSQSVPGQLFAQVRSKRPAINIAKLPFIEKRYKR
ncbi:MAG: glycine cleavage system aminomethyltransferase GcvT [Burkholderiaceae bacterium]